MGRERYSGSGVVIDRCGCGVWLDKGELERIAAYGSQVLEEMKSDPSKGGYPPDLYERAFSRFYFDLGTPPAS